MPAPPVSILMPVRNEALYLPSALQSLYRQTFSNWELVAVDDGSTDATPEILESASRHDSRVRPIIGPRTGLVSALTTGLAACHAPLIARMDGDDISHPRRLELQSAFLSAQPEIGLVACGFRSFPRHSLKQGLVGYETWQNALNSHDLIMRDLYVESPFVHPSVMLRRSRLDAVGGYRSTGWAEDYDLWFRLAETGTRFARLHQTLFFWRDHPERATRTLGEYSADAFRRCKLHFLRRGFLRGVTTVIIAGAGKEGRAWRRLLAEEGIGVSCWIDVDPRKVGCLLHGAPVIPARDLRLAGQKMIVAIGVRGAREQFRLMAASYDIQEGSDFICVA